MTVVQYEQPPPLPASRPGDEHDPGPAGWVARLRAAAEIAQHIAQTDFVPASYRGNPPAIAAAILYGQEVGLEPMQALAKIAVIKGRPTLTAEAQRSLILAHGHELWLEESTVTRAICAGRRNGEDRVGRVTWTLDDAKRAGIAGGQNWRAYPREMLVARATATLARQMFADVIGGLAASEELDDTDNGVTPTATITTTADAEPVKTTRTRKRATTNAAVAPTPPPDTQPDPETTPEPPATEATKRRIFAAMRDQGFTERQHRLAYVSRIAGRKIESSNDLTASEASKVIQALESSEGASGISDAIPDTPETPADPDTGADTTDEEQRLNRLIGRLDQAVTDSLDKRTATIHDLWEITAAFRHRLVPDLIQELAGQPDEQLLWQPLRDTLRADEAADLLTHLNARQRQLNPDDIPF